MHSWTWNDGWILAATYLAGKDEGTTLQGVIGAADAINHAIPTAGQLSRAFSRLAGSGVVVIRNQCYGINGGCMLSLTSAMQGKGGLFSCADKCLQWLKQQAIDLNRNETVKVSESEVKLAYDEYLIALKDRR